MKINSESLYFLSAINEFSEGMEVEILTTAKQTDERYGDFSFSEKDLQEMADNFNEDVVGTPIAVDLNHDPEGIALAWIKPASMRVGPSKKLKGETSLYAKLAEFTPKGEDLVKTGAVRLFSVEVQKEFKKFVGGAKKVFKNVIRGLALTNRPVIKDMAPTFSEKNLSNNSYSMNLESFKSLSKKMLAKATLTDEDVSMVSSFVSSLPEEEQEKAKAEVEKLAAKVASYTKAADEAKEVKKVSDKALSELTKSSFSLAEVQEVVKLALKEPMKKITEVYAEARKATLSENVKTLVFSEKLKLGIKPAATDKVLAFVTKLSDELSKEYFAIHKDLLTSVDLSEHGSGEEGEVEVKPEEKDAEEATKELSEIATKIMDEKSVKFSEAFDLALARNPELAQAADKALKA